MLEFVSVASHPEYVAPKMLSFLNSHELTDKIQVAQIDPQYADGKKLSEAYGVDINQKLNCLAFVGKRDGQIRYAAVVVPYGKRVNSGAVLKYAMDATKPSFANLDDVIAMTCMEFGSITPVGLPDDWQVLIGSSVKELDAVIIGGDRVDAKFKTTPQILARLPHAKFVDQLAK